MNATAERNRIRVGRLGSFRKMAPTKQHRIIAFAGILGTIYAVAPDGKVTYCDYRDEEAKTLIGPVDDIRLARASWSVSVSWV